MSAQLPKSDALLKAVISCLKSNSGAVHIDAIEKYVRQNLKISDEAASVIRKGKRTELAYKLAWARSKAKSEGLIKSQKYSYWELK